MTRFLPYCLLLLCALMPSAARAYSDHELFVEGTLLGGGGGRFFTGSPVDGYSCAVCHRGGPTPTVTVIGLPIDGYDPGVTYQVELRWSEPVVSHALALELIKLNGQGAGVVALPAPEQITAAGRCDQAASGQVASYLVASSTRRIVGLSDCGAASVRFNFTAPVDDEIAFAATVVRSDSSGTPDGDGVLELSKVLRRRGTALATRGSTTCSVLYGSPPVSRPCYPLALSALFIIGLLRRRRMYRTKRARTKRMLSARHRFSFLRPLR